MRSAREVDAIIDAWQRGERVDIFQNQDKEQSVILDRAVRKHIGLRNLSPNPLFNTGSGPDIVENGGNHFLSMFADWLEYRLNNSPIITCKPPRARQPSFTLTRELGEQAIADYQKRMRDERIPLRNYTYMMDIIKEYQDDVQSGWRA
jgi:hypothetical protein